MAGNKAHWVIPIANEPGYFPTERQATEINVRSATLYADRYGGRPPKGAVPQDAFDQTIRQAIHDVMTEAAERKLKR